MTWNAIQYQQFIRDRTQPAIDLALRIPLTNPRFIVDIGCGPGNSTKILSERFPLSHILGIDNSPNMIAQAQKENPNLHFRLCDALSIEEHCDLLFSNACLQWIPNHQTLLPSLMNKLNTGGVLAVQMPYNQREPLYQIIDETLSNPKWELENIPPEHNLTLPPKEYYNILSSCSISFDIWETKYYHNMPNHQSLIEWVTSTKLRPYLHCLSEDKGTELKKEIIERIKTTYPPMHNGNIVFGFQRLFFIAKK